LTPVRVLALTRYGELGASSRLRFVQYFQSLHRAGVEVDFQPLFGDAALTERYRAGRYRISDLFRSTCRRVSALTKRYSFNLLWVEKECLPWMPVWLEAGLLRGVPYAIDYDDAVFHNYDQHRLRIVRLSLGHRLDHLMSHSALVVGGNSYLCHRARQAGARDVVLLPTVVDLERYPVSSLERASSRQHPMRIVWIGSPSTARYLVDLSASLRELAKRVPFVLRVIGAKVEIPGVVVECVQWALDSEVTSIAECEIGVMPLVDSLWERGKCGYKLIQYMACGLPVIASPVGANVELVSEGVNGYLAESPAEWVEALERLLTSADLRLQLGAQGRRRVEEKYCLQVTAPTLAALLRKAAAKSY